MNKNVLKLLFSLTAVLIGAAGCALHAERAAPNMAAPVASVPSASIVNHKLNVRLNPAQGELFVEDEVTLPERLQGAKTVYLLLHAGLSPKSVSPETNVVAEKISASPDLFGPGGSSGGLPSGVESQLYRVDLPPGAAGFSLTYGGKINHDLSGEETYSRGFRQTPGLISEEGVYLSSSTLWYPWFGEDLLTFSLDASTPSSWKVVSQGRRTLAETTSGGERSVWEISKPQDDIFVIAAEFTEYSKKTLGKEALVFLRNPDQQLAEKYLEVTSQYLRMYSELLGPYPYSKFALIENFWETGYGMPSFTLLGPKVIRFPFIMHSSYPHEILHNWWGNGVFVDYESGNWCEGLTAYLADHLIQEGRGQGVQYRQETLQKYADYAAKNRDFPLSEFTSRHSAASESIGYGKSLMFYHMLRRKVGDKVFVEALRRFYKENMFRDASFTDLEKVFSSVSGKDMSGEFDQWVRGIGAPSLTIADARAEKNDGGWKLTVELEQIQDGQVYENLLIPVAATLEGRDKAFQTTVVMNERKALFEFTLDAKPLRIDVDPEFDLFRKLDPAEIPPALSSAFGGERVVVVLPSSAPSAFVEAYESMAKTWADGQPGEWEIVKDDALAALPTDCVVFVFGWENRFRTVAEELLKPYGAEFDGDKLAIGGMEINAGEHSFVAALRGADSAGPTIAFVASARAAAIPGLGRKLPHYHKYSYLAFEGDEPENILKGRWPVINSPMTVQLDKEHFHEIGQLTPREPLAKLPPSFSKEQMLKTVEILSSDEYQGRGAGTPGLDKAADFIAENFKQAGLLPGGGDGTYFQEFMAEIPGQGKVRLRNVVGIIPGSNPDFKDQSIVTGAHYDHLGSKCELIKPENMGEIHPGADDNASGVAVLLELAKTLGTSLKPERTAVFAAFSGEEYGRLGSKHYAVQDGEHPAEKAIGMLNLDTVGRLEDGKLLALGAGSAKEWIHIFRGVGYVTGVPVEAVNKDAGGSDQVSFIEVGVPAVQLFSGPHLDYHCPSDTAEKIDGEGLIKVASVAREVVEYLGSRPEPMNSLIEIGSADKTSVKQGTRKVSLGTVPDFAYDGSGVKLDGVSPGSPAERAGLAKGDVIISLGGRKISDLSDLSDALKSMDAGQKVEVVYLRNSKEEKLETVLDER